MDDKLTIITNNVPRDVVEAHELTLAEREDFDYLDWQAIEDGRDSASFVRYKGSLVPLDEFTRWTGPEDSPLAVWDGYMSDTFFSGWLIRYVREDDGTVDAERVVMGRFYS